MEFSSMLFRPSRICLLLLVLPTLELTGNFDTFARIGAREQGPGVVFGDGNKRLALRLVLRSCYCM